MVKYVVMLKRLPDLDRATFARVWREDHHPLIAALPGVRRIQLDLAVDSDSYPAPYDGIGTLWFDSQEAALAAFASPAGQTARRHTATFADSGAALRLFVEPLEES